MSYVVRGTAGLTLVFGRRCCVVGVGGRVEPVSGPPVPALDPRALQFIADTMERIADLEEQLRRARAEIRQLEQSEQQYQRYIEPSAGSGREDGDSTRQRDDRAEGLANPRCPGDLLAVWRGADRH